MCSMTREPPTPWQSWILGKAQTVVAEVKDGNLLEMDVQGRRRHVFEQ